MWSQDAITDILATESAMGSGVVVYTPLQKSFTSLQAQLTSFDADGFTLNWLAHSPAVGIHMTYIAIKGTINFKSAVGSVVTPASTGGTATVTGLGFTPRCGLFANANLQAFNTMSTGAHGGVGWADVNKNMFQTSIASRFYAGYLSSYHTSHDQMIHRYSLYSNGSRLEDVSLSSWNTGGFTILSNYNVGGSYSRMGYLVMNASAVTPPTPGGSDVFGYMV
jgi:hypothetical protein